MRELKFRVWDETLKEFFFDGFHINSKGTLVNCPWIERTQKERDRLIKENMSVDGKYHQDKMPRMGYIVQQYTGLKDKKELEIYEGDILKIKMMYMGKEFEAYYAVELSAYKGLSLYIVKSVVPDCTYHCSIQWENGGLCTAYVDAKYDKLAMHRTEGRNSMRRESWVEQEYSEDIEIVGNIHQNPELLEKR